MTSAGILFMILSWSFILYLCFFTYKRLLATPKKKQKRSSRKA